ncbi:acetyl-CoA carboxylase biotin carboxyl carrier protein subunit, partial [Lentimicrobium sp.]|uniref:acetyl-CoA carboxylase biotin carboxyl carrier protein subunit n=1 Tax=Lentimicrobium sp. TaxID=2034841 RepID=UPI00345E6602
ALTEALLREDDSASYLILDGLSYSFHACADEKGVITVNICGFQFQFERADMARPEHVDVFNAGELQTDLSKIVSPMPGKVIKVNVPEGEKVYKGQVLLVVEAMKMENNVLSPADGLIKRLYVKEGDTVDGSALLVNLDTTS